MASSNREGIKKEENFLSKLFLVTVPEKGISWTPILFGSSPGFFTCFQVSQMSFQIHQWQCYGGDIWPFSYPYPLALIGVRNFISYCGSFHCPLTFNSQYLLKMRTFYLQGVTHWDSYCYNHIDEMNCMEMLGHSFCPLQKIQYQRQFTAQICSSD